MSSNVARAAVALSFRDIRPFLENDDLESGLGQLQRARSTARTGAHHTKVGLDVDVLGLSSAPGLPVPSWKLPNDCFRRYFITSYCGIDAKACHRQQAH